MNKLALLFIFCNIFWIEFDAKAQNNTASPGILSAKVLDATQQQPVEFATISLLRVQDSALVTGIVTDETGSFILKDIPLGQYRVLVNFIGYQAQELGPIEFTKEKPVHQLPDIVLQSGETVMNETEITGEKGMMQLGLDRKIFNVDKSLLAQGGTATDVLRNVPTLDVDQDGQIKLRGNAGVTVLINGRPSALTGASRKAILDQIPANMVKSVEIITNPSAKFDPDGLSGIINIVLKKNKLEGFSVNSSYSIGTLGDKHNGTVGINYRNKKINLFANYNVNSNRVWRDNYNRRKNIGADTSYYFEQANFSRHYTQTHFAKVGMDYYINDKNTLSFSGSVTPAIWNNHDTIDYRFMDEEEVLSRHYRRDGNDFTRGLSMEYNMNYTKQFRKPKQQLSFDATFSDYSGKNSNDYENLDYDNQGNLLTENTFRQWNGGTEKNRVFSGQVDYTHPFEKWGGQFEMGAKTIQRDMSNDFKAQYSDASSGEMVNDAAVSNHFRYTEQVYAAYSTFGHKIKKFSYQLGLRLEQALTHSMLLTTGEEYRYNYFSFFPSAHINYELPKEQQLQLAYSRRISRPDYEMLNPFISYSDPYNVHQGNPYLKPEYINSIELNYAKYWKKLTLTGSLYYRQSTNVFRRMFLVDETTGVGRVRYLNFAGNQSYGVELVSNYRPFKWWNLNGSVNIYTMQEDGSNIGNYSNKAIWGHANLSSNFTLPKGFGIQTNVFYRSPLKLVIGNISEMWSMTFAASKSLFKGKGSISFRIQDPFRLQRFDLDLKDFNYTNIGRHRWESRVAYLTFTYNFGKMDMQTRNRMRGNGGQQRGGGVGL